MIEDILRREFYHNRISEYLVCLAIIVGGILAVRIVESLAMRRLKAWAEKTSTTYDDFLVDRIRGTGIPLAYLGIAQAALRFLTLTPRVERIIDVAGIVLLTLIVIFFLVALVRYGFEEYMRKRGEDASSDRALKGVVGLAKALVWITGALFMLDNLGFRISTVVAGLGIGGIAIALAAQAILGDLFGYFVILFDRPFEIGDFVVVGDYMGVIERFGIKTTRIASLDGEQIVVSNKDLTDSRVRNYKRMARRRVAFRLGVTYQTPATLLREIPGIVADIFREIEGAALDRVHFFSCGDFSLIYEIVYYVDGNDYTKYMDIQQMANLRIYEEFGKRRIEFAYPTRTLYLNKN
ncbi:MAG: mechanosensitive ion channel family protein [Deltaproteobacteria bacterium]|nr:mechanosensitive ion channel family protein [Deltaproteobacteria bacterium]MDA8180480.1 mechanosensitive ion channel family protein [Deltaproteobacteria bacterium]